MSILSKLFGRRDVPRPQLEPDSATVIAVCPNCGCDFRVESAEARDYTGKVAKCHCGHRFAPVFFDEVIQLEATAPHPCSKWGGMFTIQESSAAQLPADRDSATPWALECPHCRHLYILGVNACSSTARDVLNLFRSSVVIGAPAPRPVLIGTAGESYESPPKTLSQLNWEMHVQAVNRILPEVMTGVIPGWVCASCSNWSNPAPLPELSSSFAQPGSG